MTDMLKNQANYRKVWAFIVGYAASWLSRRFGLDIGPVLDAIIDLSFGILTGFFVWLIPNVRKLFHIETVTTVSETGEVAMVETTVAEMDKSTGQVEAVAQRAQTAAVRA